MSKKNCVAFILMLASKCYTSKSCNAWIKFHAAYHYCAGMVLSVQSTLLLLVLWPYMEWSYPGWCYYKIKECVTYPEMFIHHSFLPFWDRLLATGSKIAFNASRSWRSSSIFELSNSVAQSLFPLCNWYLTWLISLCASWVRVPITYSTIWLLHYVMTSIFST